MIEKMERKTRTLRIQFRVSPEELAVIEQKQRESRMVSRERFMRKMVMTGQVLMLDVPELRQISALLGHCSANLNQIAKRVNGTGRLYEGELAETQQAVTAMTEELRKVYQQLTKIKA